MEELYSSGISQDDLQLFLQEADEQLQSLDENFIRLEREPSNEQLIQEIFRIAHTIKGSAAMIGHQRMSELAHAMEDILDKVRKKTLAVTPVLVDILLKSLDMLKALKEELATGDNKGKIDIRSVLAELTSVTTEMNQHTAPAKENYGPDFYFSDDETRETVNKAIARGLHAFEIAVELEETEWTAVRSYQVIQELSSRGEILKSVPSIQELEQGKATPTLRILFAGSEQEKIYHSLISTIENVKNVRITTYTGNKQPATETQQATQSNTEQINIEQVNLRKEENLSNQTVRVNVTYLDTLMEQIGELVISRNSISQIARTLAEKYPYDELVESLNDNLSQINTIVSTLQQDIMSIRMLPIDIVFNSLPRMVRDLARKTGKKINFIVEGQDTEVDRSVIEYLKDPLVHLLRNSVDHGIETVEERKASGKPETGTIKLQAYQEQDNIIIKVTDDGKGIDPTAVKQAAIRKQIISADTAERMTENEIINLIFVSGLSTAKKASQISGRGVGLDIVKTNVQALGGSIKVNSKLKEGTTFTLILPLTLAIIPVLLVTSATTTFAIPLSGVIEVGKLKEGDIRTIQGREATLLRNRVLPVIRLNRILGWDNGFAHSDAEYNMVVIKYAEQQMGIIVDSLIGQQEIVVKALNQYAGGEGFVSGASVLGDGQVVLIIDIGSMYRIITKEHSKKDMDNYVVT